MAGIPYYRELTFDPAETYTSSVAADIMKPVVGATTTDSGTLKAYDNTNKKWIVKPDEDTDLFDEAEAISITEGTGAGTTLAASTEFIYLSEPSDVQNEIIKTHSNMWDHNKAAEDLRDWMRARGVSDDNLDTLLITRDLKQIAVYLANTYTCERNSTSESDFWHEKMLYYEQKVQDKWSSLELAFDADDDDVIDQGERTVVHPRVLR